MLWTAAKHSSKRNPIWASLADCFSNLTMGTLASVQTNHIVKSQTCPNKPGKLNQLLISICAGSLIRGVDSVTSLKDRCKRLGNYWASNCSQTCCLTRPSNSTASKSNPRSTRVEIRKRYSFAASHLNLSFHPTRKIMNGRSHNPLALAEAPTCSRLSRQRLMISAEPLTRTTSRYRWVQAHKLSRTLLKTLWAKLIAIYQACWKARTCLRRTALKIFTFTLLSLISTNV